MSWVFSVTTLIRLVGFLVILEIIRSTETCFMFSSLNASLMSSISIEWCNPLITKDLGVRLAPGTPKYSNNIQYLVDHACSEAELYQHLGLDGLLVENMHDVPYVTAKNCGPEVTAVMTRVCSEVRQIAPSLLCGVQVLAGNNESALAVALSSDEGIIEACAGPLLRYRRAIGAEHVFVFTDIKKKHCAHAITADVDVVVTARAAEYFLSDGIIITGQATADPPSVKEFHSVKQSVSLPILIGSGVTASNVQQYTGANGFIVGSHFKVDGHWKADIDRQRIHKFMDNIHELRSAVVSQPVGEKC
ncbi:uncharacterized protein F13E9.13, mitochondrial isoform X1 [Tachypleus tridentatus]|uniref:uncharacterized protein F13E9.13, mitochondrial isoform X1 n=1 Tax=Tachypleus tridentatus TaxID=6853 RepID=UPI003FD5E6B5